MAGLIYELFASSALLSLGLYHIISTTRNYLKSPQSYSAKPYHPFSFSFSSSPSSSSSSHHNNHSRFKHIQLYLLIACLFIAFIHQTLISFDSDPLLRGRTPVHRFTSLQSAVVCLLFLVLAVCLLISDSTSFLPFPSDLFFALAAAVFYLQYAVSSSSASVQMSDLQAKCDSISARVSALLAILCAVLACQPRFFVADVALGGAVCLQGFWELQTGLSLYVDAFIPEGCHKLLDVVKGVEGSTKCDLEESKLRAVSILDLMFLLHVMFVFIIVMVTYGVAARNVAIKRAGSYEPLANSGGDANNHIQMKALIGTQA